MSIQFVHTFKSRVGVATAALIVLERLKNVRQSLTGVYSILDIPQKGKVKKSKVR
jgi:hypothetical protein